MKNLSILSFIIAFALSFPVYSQQIRIVNMIPNAQSNETAHDREPNLAINPANPSQMVGTAFTPNPLGATTPPSAPIFFSIDGGQTWVLNSNVPSNISTGDITAKFGTTTNWLYASILRRPAATGATRTMDILRTNNFASPNLMQVLLTRNQPDQPYVYATTPSSGTGMGTDRMYVGNNDLGVTPQSATIDQSLNASATTPTLTNNVIERRTPSGQDGPPVRMAIHPNGTIYSVYAQRTASAGSIRTANIVVVRDDNWGSGASPYAALTDPSDGLAGRFVVTGVQYPFISGTALGQERLGDRVCIAVDPNNDRSVYVAWTDNNPTGGNTSNIHIRRSTDAGANWSAADLYQVNNAVNPDIAINSLGEVAFSYQQLVGGNWLSMVERTTNDFVTRITNTLNTFPDNTPAGGTFFPYLGDYAFLTAMPSGKDFCGVFSASNDPAPARFPTVLPNWQRNLNTGTNQLRNLTNTANVNISIDPYFYRVTPVSTDDDFYVRDWTTNATTRDLGEEPSTNPVFYRTSDIWNRRNNSAGAFNANDQPANLDPWPATSGNNFAFARVHRRAAGAAATVNLLFLKSEFGTGSNYQLINGVSSFASLSFSSTDVVQTMASGVQWDLVDPAAVTANHVCMAVEIAGPGDPSGNPTLLGRAPGWSNGTDLLVLADNNKAQRNLNVYTGTDSGESMSMYAIIHNAALQARNMRVVFDHGKGSLDRKRIRINVLGGKEQGRFVFENDTLILMNMKPCENRWVELTVSNPAALPDKEATYLFKELVGAMTLNGFGIQVKTGKLQEMGWENLGEHAFVFDRINREYELPGSKDQAMIALELLEDKADESNYLAFMEKQGPVAVKLVKTWLEKVGDDAFGLTSSASAFSNFLSARKWKEAAVAHGNLVRKLNAYLSYRDKKLGDVADILQTIRWQRDVMHRSESFTGSSIADDGIARADEFIDAYSRVKITNSDYAAFVRENLPLWMELCKKHFPNHNFDSYFEQMKDAFRNPKMLQSRHCAFVMELARTAKL